MAKKITVISHFYFHGILLTLTVFLITCLFQPVRVEAAIQTEAPANPPFGGPVDIQLPPVDNEVQQDTEIETQNAEKDEQL